MLKFSCGRCVRILVMFLDILHISFVSLLIILTSFSMLGLENGSA